MTDAQQRRHETAIDGVTAWAGPWEDYGDGGDWRCVVASGGDLPSATVVVSGDRYWIDDRAASLHRTPEFGMVFSAVLAEAAEIAQGGEVPE